MPFCIAAPDILLPKKGTDYTRWAVIACDQFTSEKEYWEELKKFVGSSVSALNIMLPEAYLQEDNSDSINEINANMRKYLEQGIFTEYKNCFVYIERSTPFAKKRRGIIAAVDLEAYSYVEGNRALIRATEGTVLSRIPPRVKIRQGAPVEIPHIMLLIDDRERSVIEPLEKIKSSENTLYDFDLNMGGGHISGYRVPDIAGVINSFKALLEPSLLKRKYGRDEQLLVAVGDGNHSLAAAKVCWETIKEKLSPEERENHPARYALAEIVNIHDEGLAFEPIHRAVFGVDNVNFVKGLKAECADYIKAGGGIIYNGEVEPLNMPAYAAEAVDAVQKYIDAYIKEYGGSVDYIHGEDSLKSVCRQKNAVGILLPPLDKNELFPYLIEKGKSLPRKTFSMGEAREKRYYIEARKII